jgi:hypothetical protein
MSLFYLALILLGAIIVFFLLLGGLTPGSGADLLDWDPAGRAERRAGVDHDDLQDMIALNNHYRRERGLAELTEEELGTGGVRTLRREPGADPGA